MDAPSPSAYPIPYDAEMLRRVRQLHAGSESLPDYQRWIDDHMGGRVLAFRRRLVPQILAFTDLRGLEILDFGCGTGSTAVAMAERAEGSRITAIDIDRQSLEIAALRCQHHGMSDQVRLQHIRPVGAVGDLPFGPRFDFVLANGVLEHVVPFSVRDKVILEMWRLLKPGGFLFISETPNTLWPIDRHTTGLPFLPWLPRKAACRLAIACGRHLASMDFDIRGWHGMSYWSIVRPLRRERHRFEVLNLTVAKNRLLPAGLPPDEAPSWRRRLGTFMLEQVAGKPMQALGIPTMALGPFIEYLCLAKIGDVPRSEC